MFRDTHRNTFYDIYCVDVKFCVEEFSTMAKLTEPPFIVLVNCVKNRVTVVAKFGAVGANLNE